MEEVRFKELRQKAIDLIKNKIDSSNSEDEINALLENVNVQTIELELQNDELARTNFELSQKEKEIIAIKNQYQQLFEFAPVGYVILDTDFVIRDCNFTFADLINLTKNHIIGKNLSKFIASNYQDDFYFFVSGLNEIEGINTLETALKLKSDEEYFVILEARKIFSEKLEIKFQIAVIDVNETQKLRQERILLDSRLQQTLSAAGTAWWEWDMINNIVIHSEKKATMLGYTLDEFPNNVYEIMKFVHPEDYEPTMEAMRKHIYGNSEIYDIEYRIKAKDGTYRWYHDKGKISDRTPEGKPAKIIGTVLDVTERKKAELKLKKSEEKYRELNSAKDKFFSIISHDLRNPFNVILTYANNLVSDFHKMEKDKVYDLIKDIQQSSKSLLTLIENLLEWSRTQTDNVAFEQTECDLYEIVFDTIYSLKNSAKVKNIEVISELEIDTIVFADYNMIKTVVRNLISNALKFTNSGGKVFVTSTEEFQNEKKYIKLSIIDNGVGIPKSRLEELFKIDKSVSTVGTNNEVGTGLGLILCKEFIEKNNGKIFAESELGIGSKFHLLLDTIVQ